MNTLETVSTKMQQIAQNAERMPHVSFTSLSYHLDMEWMYEAYKETRKDGAVGVDGQTAREFHEDLKGNLESLLEQAKSIATSGIKIVVERANGYERGMDH